MVSCALRPHPIWQLNSTQLNLTQLNSTQLIQASTESKTQPNLNLNQIQTSTKYKFHSNTNLNQTQPNLIVVWDQTKLN